jgi:hypothetical protein
VTQQFPSRRRWRFARSAGALIALAFCLAACGSGGSSSSGSTSTTADTTDGVVWLCRPGHAPDPCTEPVTTTSVEGDGHTRVTTVRPPASAPIDCFYVYPTVSKEKTQNANLDIQPQETGVAIAQASPFSQDCNVYAPMYPQGTLHDIGNSPANTPEEVAYNGLLKAWNYYINHLNDGRGFVIYGHSQGAEILTKLVQQQIDPNPALRKRMISAVLLGGDVLVKTGQRAGGYFQNIPTCDSATETSCVIAYSSFYQEPPSNTRFGRAEEGPGAHIATLPPSGTPVQVACVDPAALLGQSSLESYFPSASSTAQRALHWWPKVEVPSPWVSFPGLYSGQCMNQGGAQWLDISVHQGPVHRKTVKEEPDQRWGLHLSDPNLTMGDLVTVVGDEAHAYLAAAPSS